MLTPVAEGVFVHRSPLLRNNSVGVQGGSGVLVVDAGTTGAEMSCLAREWVRDIHEGQARSLAERRRRDATSG